MAPLGVEREVEEPAPHLAVRAGGQRAGEPREEQRAVAARRDRGEHLVEVRELVGGRMVAELVEGVDDGAEHVLDDLAAEAVLRPDEILAGERAGNDTTSWSRSVP